jgi:hypothetical protein
VIISGHGQVGSQVCAEFCNTQHHFLVNGAEELVDFPYLDGGGNPEGCQEEVRVGTVPNQYGTWPFFRSNWCPGREVDPIYIDVTDSIDKGELNSFEYYGDRNGAPYDDGGASISLSSFVTIHQ